ncbi:sarcosine oxidase subunit gamma [Albirhodobacter sp. R86504]|uniref:sarcosine oxidase subunit gamma n=1 Tax=Albirhodobacter sp. R86504 TaxID=3093848 RepID=UPI00366C3DBC
MTDLSPMTALGAQSARRQTHGVLTLTEQTDLALASLSLRRGSVLPTPFGLTLPDVGKCTDDLAVSAFWIGPDQWMVAEAGKGDVGIAQALKREAPDCSVTDQTDGFVAFEITSSEGGAPITAVMSKLVNLDAVAFVPGCATRTGLEHMSVYILRRAENTLAVIGMRSLADTLWHALDRAAFHAQGKIR